MIFNSIKWRLQLWYGLILVAVLVGFGLAAYQLERNRQFRRVDDEIHRRVDLLARALHGPPRGRGFHPPNPGGPPPEEFPDDAQPRPGFGPPQGFHLPPEAAGLFDASDPHGFYFTILRDGNEIAGTTNAPNEFTPPAPNGEHGPALMHGTFREVVMAMPSGEWIRVGKNVAPELKELQLTASAFVGIGAAILLLGLAGGWWFVGRALRPISDISSTAAKISSGDLSQRINLADAQSELGQLAAVLNSTFARLETAFAQQKQFASDAAHELRTPVSVILTQTQTALSRERDAGSYRQTVEACQRAAQRMRQLIESLLELARFDAGQEVLNRLRFDFSRTLAECEEMVRPLAEERRVKIVSDLQPLEITGDSERLAQVAINLLTNAIQYNQPDGQVRVTLAARDGLAILEITDTGQGIDPENLPHVFERFYRADKSRASRGNAGLGLAICKAIVEAHGGTIEVSSAEKAGATVSVRLPTGG